MMLKSYISEFLAKYKCPVEYLGYSIFCDALYFACQDLIEIDTSLKNVYVDLSAKFHMTRLSLERNLRTLIEKWELRPNFKELFEKTPTNSELILTIAHKLVRPNSSVFDILLS